MNAETAAYRVLVADEELNRLFDTIRGGPFGHGFKQGIFTYDIPEKPTNLKRKELAPFMRIYATYDEPYEHSDDVIVGTEQRFTLNFWCETGKQVEALVKRIDILMEEHGFERYTANEKPRYWDGDIGLIMNVRKYRFFDWGELEKLEGK